ncbi:hypothetical protein [Shewanella donghaensis]|uniref:hypothetical protein n=1 Tax=Shewanella donghaensis TaxID=238836 RepID=UPI001D0378F1|nr:hypothetical protein [Shewanella donghaensis]
MQLLTKIVVLLFFILNLSGCDSQSKPKSTKINVVDSSLCQFEHGSCNQVVNSVEVRLLINPTFTPSEKPLAIDLAFSDAVEDVSMRIEGRDMFMGLIPVALKSDDSQNYVGTAIYGSCSSNYMVWRALVSFKVNGKPQSTWFDFLADNQ